MACLPPGNNRGPQSPLGLLIVSLTHGRHGHREPRFFAMPFMYDDNKGGITPGANRDSSPGVSQGVSRVDAMLCDTTRDKLLALRAVSAAPPDGWGRES